MRFQYTPLPVPGTNRATYQPMLSVWLRGPRGRCRLRMVVDSGSTETLVPSSILNRIGVAPSGERVSLVGLGGASIEADVARVQVEFGGGRFAYASRVAAHSAIDHQFCVLGHRDFFENFRVSFFTRDRIFAVSDY